MECYKNTTMLYEFVPTTDEELGGYITKYNSGWVIKFTIYFCCTSLGWMVWLYAKWIFKAESTFDYRQQPFLHFNWLVNDLSFKIYEKK
jgi:hypothetical protein